MDPNTLSFIWGFVDQGGYRGDFAREIEFRVSWTRLISEDERTELNHCGSSQIERGIVYPYDELVVKWRPTLETLLGCQERI